MHLRRTLTSIVAAIGCLGSIAACTMAPAGSIPASPAPPRIAASATPQWRPALHYTPARNWMNDPNGMVYADGVYHLFYQYNPHGNSWGDMSWGHATSTDLIHWKHRPVAMPATGTREIFSGSIVADTANTSGLGDGIHTPLVALYTSAYRAGAGHAPGTQAQSLAYSLDGGASWKQYDADPVLTLSPENANFRDPKVFWYSPGKYWVMTTVVADARVVKIYRSADLIHWSFLSDFDGASIDPEGILWEMPDLIPLDLDGNPAKPRWVMIVNINPGSIAGGSGARYFVGSFDGTTFRPEDVPPAGSDPSDSRWLDHGADYYAASTFSGLPSKEPVSMAWMSNWDYAAAVPTSPWRGSMTLPRRLSLETIAGKAQLVQLPVAQVDAAFRQSAAVSIGHISVDGHATELPTSTRGTVQQVEATITPGRSTAAGLIVRGSPDGRRGTRIYYDNTNGTLVVDRSHSDTTNFSRAFSRRHIVRVPLNDGSVTVRVIVDRGSVEVFAGSGRTVVTDLVFPGADDDRLRAFATGGRATLSDVRVSTLAP